MAQSFKSVDEYLAAQPAAVQSILAQVRRSIRNALPGSEELITYQMPTYKLHGGAVLYFAGWKQHWSLYPATDKVIAACKKELSPYEVEKGTIRFPLDQPVPLKLVERIARLRAQEVAASRPTRKSR